ncbi:P-loop NTPase fold protein [Amycolatopsis sp. GM8]|uniref:P-loop NTPase fold protein n=1 Tax=Amycolatopsis sp. GM8 TaxID=2896530 RepID=UPI001F21F9A1|nr:P-loop NTPase fold protein [Amycolatopsis sp. GM8]
MSTGGSIIVAAHVPDLPAGGDDRQNGRRQKVARLLRRTLDNAGQQAATLREPGSPQMVAELPRPAAVAPLLTTLTDGLRDEAFRHNRLVGADDQLRFRLVLDFWPDDSDGGAPARHAYLEWLLTTRALDDHTGTKNTVQILLSESVHLLLGDEGTAPADFAAFESGWYLYATDQVKVWRHEVTTPAKMDVPVQVPHPPKEFFGHATEMDALDAAFDEYKTGRGPGVIVLTGADGLGKTALAAQWIESHAGEFPDGQLYVDLGTLTGDADAMVQHAFERLLTGLQVPVWDLPATTGARIETYRKLVAGRQVVVLLDNPVPAVLASVATGGLVLLTARRKPAGITAREIPVGVLQPLAAAKLVESIVDVTPAEAEELAETCDYSPGMITAIASAVRLVAGPTVRQRVDHLADEAVPLHDTADTEPEITHARVLLRYRRLAPDESRALRLLALVDPGKIVATELAALTGSSAREADRVLAKLGERRLLHRHEATAEYQMASQVHEYARKRLDAEEPPEERARAERRLAETASIREEFVAWLSDAPETKDALKRDALADVLATRLKQLSERDPTPSFLIHLEGPWGSGKSTLLTLLAPKLDSDFLVVDFDAWRNCRVDPPWWTLLSTFRQQLARSLSPTGRMKLRFAEAAVRARRSVGPYFFGALVLLAVLVLAGGALVLSGTAWRSATFLGNLAKSTTAVLAVLGVLWGAILLTTKFLLWDSARGARRLEQHHTNPMQEVSEHFGWLISRSAKRVVFFVDDLDRCGERYIVELLDAIQTLVRDAPSKSAKRRSAYFVIAADGRWLRRAYEVVYDKFTEAGNDPGRPLGYLFLDKLFQLSVPLPAIGPNTRTLYFNKILGIRDGAAERPLGHEAARVERQVRASSAGSDVMRAWMDAPGPVREYTAPSAVKKLAESERSDLTEHALQKFATLLHGNPRSMKRFLNTYGVLRAARTLEGVPVSSDALALWTILRVRWPALADHLEAHPDAVAEHPYSPELDALLKDPELREVLDYLAPLRLTPGLIRNCCGAQA